jgi:hypothetical protein
LCRNQPGDAVVWSLCSVVFEMKRTEHVRFHGSLACDQGLPPGFAAASGAAQQLSQRREGAAAGPITAACREHSSTAAGTAAAWHQCRRRVGASVVRTGKACVAVLQGGRKETEEGARGGVPSGPKQWTHIITALLTREGRIRLETVTHAAAHKLRQGLECDQKRKKRDPSCNRTVTGQCSAIGPSTHGTHMQAYVQKCERRTAADSGCSPQPQQRWQSRLRGGNRRHAYTCGPSKRGVRVVTGKGTQPLTNRTQAHTAGKPPQKNARLCHTQGPAANAAKPEPGARNNLRTVGICLLSGPLPLCFKQTPPIRHLLTHRACRPAPY